MDSDNTQVSIRAAVLADAPTLVAHIERLLREPDPWSPLSPEEFVSTAEDFRQTLSDFARRPNSVYLVAEAGGELVGELNLKGARRAALRHTATLGMSVREERRNGRVGSRLLEADLRWAGESGIVTRLELYVYAHNQAAIHLYEKFGFEVEGRRRKAVFQGGKHIDDLIMARLLDG